MNSRNNHSVNAKYPTYFPLVTAYNTNDVEPAQRLAYWDEGIRELLSPTENVPLCDAKRGVDAHFRNIDFGGLNVIDYRTSPMRDARTRRMLAKHPNDDFFILKLKSGNATLSQSGKAVELASGDVAMYDSGREFVWDFPGEASMVIARLPRKQVTSKMPSADRLAARKIERSNPFSIMLGNTIEGALSFDAGVSEFDISRYGHTVTDTLATYLELGLNPPNYNSRTDDVLARAKKVLLENLDNSDFDLSDLAERISASQRTICRAFASENTTASRWLWSKRVDMAYELIASGLKVSISEVALRCGYRDFSHFSRSFKKAHNSTPTECLHISRS